MIVTELVDLKEKGQIAIVHLNNPETRNSMTLEMGLQFENHLKGLTATKPMIRALVITGKNGVFSSGGDLGLLRSFAKKNPDENKHFMESFYRLFLSVREMPFPVIAAVNGHAIGAALALAMACDIRYFIPEGKYAFNFVRIGIHPGMGSSFLVKEVAGLHNAQELLLTGRQISGNDALQRGLCHALHPAENILAKAIQTATEIAGASPSAVRLTKAGLYSNRTLNDAIDYEARSQSTNYGSKDFIRALDSIENRTEVIFHDD